MNVKQKISKLPQLVKRLLTLLVVLVMSVLLTTVRHNDSAYLTGVWDLSSQALVYGRMLQMQYHQHWPGGFMGVYAPEEEEGYDRQQFLDNQPVTEGDYRVYAHQTGLQGWGFGILNKVYSLHWPGGLDREVMLYKTNCTLFYAVELLICLFLWRKFGLLPAAAWLLSIVFGPWPQRGMKNLYWCLWTWVLPLLASLWLCRRARRCGRVPVGNYLLVAATCLVRCMCGFEFITTFLILCEIPLCYEVFTALCCQKDRSAAMIWLRRTVYTGLAALGGVAAALGIWFVQMTLCFGGVQRALEEMLFTVSVRVTLTDSNVRSETVPQVLHYYFVENGEPVVQIGSFSLSILPLLVVTAVLFVLCGGVLAVRHQSPARLVPLLVVWVLSIAAPASWMVLSRAHSIVHKHLVPMLWHFAPVPVSCMLLLVLAKMTVTALWRRRPDLVASH